jgi:hypothetical protein
MKETVSRFLAAMWISMRTKQSMKDRAGAKAVFPLVVLEEVY